MAHFVCGLLLISFFVEGVFLQPDPKVTLLPPHRSGSGGNGGDGGVSESGGGVSGVRGVERVMSERVMSALAGNLVSPSRGLLIFSPVLVFVGYLHVCERRHVPLPQLAGLAWGVLALHTLVI